MSTDANRATLSEARRLLGLERPPTGWWRWLRDPHFLLCVVAAVPVWLAIGALAAGPAASRLAPWGVVSLVLVQPVVEELVFRGALQGVLLARGWSRGQGRLSLANIGTSAAFVAAHFIWQPPAWAIAVLVPSLIFGHLRERLHSVLPAMALHAIYNAGFALSILWLQRGH